LEPPAAPGVLWLIFVDDLHVRFVDTGRLRTLIRTIATTLLAEGDLIAARATVFVVHFWCPPVLGIVIGPVRLTPPASTWNVPPGPFDATRALRLKLPDFVTSTV